MTGDDNNNYNGGVRRSVNFEGPRSFKATFKSKLKETLFPDDPFKEMKREPFGRRALKTVQYFIPITEWLPKYTFNLFKYDVLAGITISSLAIPQGISYASLAKLPPVIGLYSSFVPPLIYTVFGSSKHLAVGVVAPSSLLIAEAIEEKVKADEEPYLYVSLVFTAALVSGLFQALLGVLRLGLLVDFLSHSTITGFMGGTAVLVIFQQTKGFLGLQHFTHKTGVIDVVKAIFKYHDEVNWRCIVIGTVVLIFLQSTRYVKKIKPELISVAAMGPIVAVIAGCIGAYFFDAQKHGIAIVGPLKKGINSLSINRIDFDPKYFSAPLKAGLITGLIAIAEGVAIGRSFAQATNEHIDGNKEMIAYGLMNIAGSLTSCYLTSGPFSKSAVNASAGCKTQMANAVQSICMLLVLLFLAPVFKYTPIVVLSTIIISAMIGLLKFKKYCHLYQTDKFDFIICMSCLFGVSFISMYMGLIISVGLALLRALLYMARPATCKLGNIPNSNLYRDIEQYPSSGGVPGFLVLQIGSPLYFANGNYMKERILRWVRDESDNTKPSQSDVEFVLLDMGGVTAIDLTGIEALIEVRKALANKEIKMILINPRLEVMDKLIVSHFIDKIGKESVFLSTCDAIEACRSSLKTSEQPGHA